MRKFKKLMIKIYLFLVSEHIGKYVLSILLCVPLLALFGMFSSDFIPELLSIGLGVLFSNLLLSMLHMLLGNFVQLRRAQHAKRVDFARGRFVQ